MRCTNFVAQRTFGELTFNSCGKEFVDLIGEFVFITAYKYTCPSTDTYNKPSTIIEAYHHLKQLYICVL